SYYNFQQSFPPINMPCPKCQRNESYLCIGIGTDPKPNYSNEVAESPDERITNQPLVASSITAAHYQCVGCRETRITFTIRIAPTGESMMKVGQYPPWSIEPSASVAKALGSHLASF